MTPANKLTYDFKPETQMTSSKKIPSPTPHNYTLAEATTEFLISLTPETRPQAQQGVNKFIRWYGDKRFISGLTIPEVSDYADYVNSSVTNPADRLEPVKTFLDFAYKQKLITTKLAPHIKFKKNAVKTPHGDKRRIEETISLTAQGYQELQGELTRLKNERPHVVEEIHKAAADKDFRENAPLEAAREYQGHLEARIRELETSLKKAVVIDEKQTVGHRIKIGDTVVIRDMGSGELITYTLVDAREANPTKGKISIVSPIGKAILGKSKGATIEVTAPAGILPYLIEDISHPQ